MNTETISRKETMEQMKKRLTAYAGRAEEHAKQGKAPAERRA